MCFLNSEDMKKLLTCMCFCTSFFLLHAQQKSIAKDTLKIKSKVETHSYLSRTPVLKIPADSNIHYHILHKKTKQLRTIEIPNSHEDFIMPEGGYMRKLNQDSTSNRVINKALRDSAFHRIDSPLRRGADRHLK